MTISISLIGSDGEIRELRSVCVDGSGLLNSMYNGAEDALVELADVPGTGFTRIVGLNREPHTHVHTE